MAADHCFVDGAAFRKIARPAGGARHSVGHLARHDLGSRFFLWASLLDMRTGERPLLPRHENCWRGRARLFLYGSAILWGAILGVLIFFFVLVLLRVLVRNRWVAAALFVILFSLPKILVSTHRLVDGPVWIIIYLITAFAVVRFGLIALAIATFTANLLLNLPFTRDLSQWYAPGHHLHPVEFCRAGFLGHYTAVAGQKLLKEELFD